MFQKLTEHDKVNFPVKKEQKDAMQYVYCDSFTGEFSSKTGIYSKNMFVARIRPGLNPNLPPEVLAPILTILCGPQCSEGCINSIKFTQNG